MNKEWQKFRDSGAEFGVMVVVGCLIGAALVIVARLAIGVFQ